MMEELHYYRIDEIPHKTLGRTAKKYPLSMFWTASGVEIAVKASELWIDFESDFTKYNHFIIVYINGSVVSRFSLEKGRKKINIFRGMNKSEIKNVKIMRESQAMGELDNMLVIHGVETDGEFVATVDGKLKIEFCGDSLTCGEGLVGSVNDFDWIPMFMSCENSFPSVCSKMLNADFRAVSQGGNGVLCGWDNNPNANIPRYYEYVCNATNGEKNISLGAHEKYDFASWKADYIVINLGVNDQSAFRTKGFTLQDGSVFKLRENADKSFNYEDVQKYQNAYINFLKLIRKNNPFSHIVVCYGIAEKLENATIEAVKKYQCEQKDENISKVKLRPWKTEERGSRGHPGAEIHKEWAGLIAKNIMSVENDKKNCK